MKVVPILALCVVASLVAIPARAQSLAPGNWSGTLRVGGSRIAVEYVVQSVEGSDSLAVTMKTASGPATPVTDLKIGERDLAFRWGAFSCSLDKKGGNKYEGNCTTADGTAGQLTLNSPQAARVATPARSGHNVITAEELAGTNASNLYDAIRKLHSEWLLPRTPTSVMQAPPPVQAYLNGQPMGGVDFFRSIPVAGVAIVEFFSASDATQRWGTGHASGAILVTQSAPPP